MDFSYHQVVLAALEYAVILYIKYVHYGNASRIGAVQKNKSKMEEAHRLCLRIDRNSRIGFPAISIIKGIIYYFYCSYGQDTRRLLFAPSEKIYISGYLSSGLL